MFKKTMTYTDWNGVERTEDVYFNLSKAEILEMQLTTEGGFDKMLERMIKAKDTIALVKLYKQLILKAYGKKSEDGRRFEKSEEITREFIESPLYSDIYMELTLDDEKAQEFVRGIMPADLSKQVDEALKKTPELTTIGGGK